MLRKFRLASASAVSRISRSPGRKTRTSPGLPAAARQRRHRWPRSRRGRGSASGSSGSTTGRCADLDGIRAAAHLDDGCVEVRGEPLGVDRRRGDDDLEVGPTGEQPGEVAQDEVDVETALVGLVDDQRVVPGQVAVTRQLGEQDPVGHELDQRVLADLIAEADLVPRRRRARCPVPRRSDRRRCARRAAAAGCGRSCR